MKTVNYQDIVRSHKIETIRVIGKNVLVNNMFSFNYSNARIAKAVATKLKMFVGVK